MFELVFCGSNASKPVVLLENLPVDEPTFTRQDIVQDLKAEKKKILELDYEKEVDLQGGKVKT